MRRRSLQIALAGALMSSAAGAADNAPAPAHVRRVAVVIGSNDAPNGRSALRYAQEDARRVADALQRVGRFAPADVHVLLDPRPAEIGNVLDVVGQVAKSEETLLLFYYSGHSDGQAIFPHGEVMQLGDLRSRIDGIAARVRVGILDTCRGGSWTQAKGLSVGPPLDAVDLMTMTSEGTALVSSSSGFEDAHEAGAVHGSFFTHHLVAGLLGAADRSGDGNVTLQEAFDYAKVLTVRDSARLAAAPQHPSFELSLRGRQDIVLAQLDTASSAINLTQTEGPLEVIQLSTGVAVVEIPSGGGGRVSRVALPPGRYLVRKVADGKTYSKEVVLAAGGTVAVNEAQLELAGAERLAMKGESEELPMREQTTLKRNWFELQPQLRMFGMSVKGAPVPAVSRYLTGEANVAYGITDRLQATLNAGGDLSGYWWVGPLGIAYRLGQPKSVEVVPYVSVGHLGTYSWQVLRAGADARVWLSESQSVVFGLGVGVDPISTGWWGYASLGYHVTVHDTVSVHVGASASGVEVFSKPSAGLLSLGSQLGVAGRGFPLVSLHATPTFSIDGYGSVGVDTSSGDFVESYGAGVTWSF